MKKFAAVFGALFLIAAFALGAIGGWIWLLNVCAAAVSSLLVAAFSFASYSKMVKNAARENDGYLTAIDDPHELFDEDAPIAENGAIAENTAPNTEKDASEKNIAPNPETNEINAPNTEKDDAPPPKKLRYFLGSFAPLRLIGYGVLAIVTIALIASGLFALAPFLIALGILPLSALLSAAIFKE
ncbi:MAG: hypothetical protein LBU73_01410 [Helicobacteraceae bacterium]|nr:hypothetical protein [Helicobacteraceae bacterium]